MMEGIEEMKSERTDISILVEAQVAVLEADDLSLRKIDDVDVTGIEDGGIVGNNTRGDEGVLEGVAIGNIDALSSDSEDDVSIVFII